MDISKIKSVCAADIYKSYAEAAFYTNNSPAVISKHVSSVEAELGIQIFERATKASPLRLTPEGKKIINNLHEILNIYNTTVFECEKAPQRHEKQLYIGLTRSIGGFFESSLLSKFQSENRDISIVKKGLLGKNMASKLSEGSLDAVFIPINEAKTQNESLPLIQNNETIGSIKLFSSQNIYLGLYKNHPFYNLSVIDAPKFKALQSETFIFSVAAQRFSFAREMQHKLTDFLGFDSEMNIQLADFSDFTVPLRLVSSGAGVLPQLCVTSMEIGNVRFVPLEGMYTTPMSLYFSYRKDAMSDALRGLVQYIKLVSNGYLW